MSATRVTPHAGDPPLGPPALGDPGSGPPGKTRRERASEFWHALVRRPSGIAGLAVVTAVLLVAILAPVLAPDSPYYQFPNGLTAIGAPLGPSWQHLLGTDPLGRDLLSRLLDGTRTTLSIALASNVVAGVVGVAFGSVAGYFGGWVDLVLMRITEVLLSVPAILLAAFFAVVARPSELSLILIIGGVNWFYLARIVRGEVLVVRTREFVEASAVAGARHRLILRRHVLPQIWPLTFVYMTVQFSTTAVFVAAMSFVGIGVQPPAPDLGNLIAQGSQYLTTVPRLAIVPGIALGIMVLGFNLLSDALRDALDVRT